MRSENTCSAEAEEGCTSRTSLNASSQVLNCNHDTISHDVIPQNSTYYSHFFLVATYYSQNNYASIIYKGLCMGIACDEAIGSVVMHMHAKMIPQLSVVVRSQDSVI